MLGWGTAITGVLGLLGLGSQGTQTQAQLDASNNTAFATSTMNAQSNISNSASSSTFIVIGIALVIVFGVYIAFKSK